MQPSREDYTTVNRRPLDAEDYIDILRRHRAWILAPTFFGLVVAVVVACLWPDTFVSVAVIRVVPAQVPERYVQSNVIAEVSQRITSMAQGILSRATLTNLVNTYNLYSSERRRMPVEDIIEDMRKQISVGAVQSIARPSAREQVSAFQVSFAYSDRFVAQRVTADLVGRFIDENIRMRSSSSVLTTQFLRDQWEVAKKDLDAVEQKLASFRTRNAGRLPEQVQLSLQRLTALDQRLTAMQDGINRTNNEKLLLEARLQTLKSQLAFYSSAAEDAVVLTAGKNERLTQLERDISNAELTLSGLRERYNDSHPDVQRLASQLNVLKQARDALLAEEQSKPASPQPAPRRLRPVDVKEAKSIEAELAKVQSEIQVRDIDLQALSKDRATLDKQIQEARQRLEASPTADSEYSLMLQDRDLARKRYDELDLKRSQSELATDLENRKQGEMLELLDPASLPQTPSAPKRWAIICIGIAVGFLLGCSLVAGREVKDTSLKNLKDVRAYAQLTVLASIPLLENDLVVRSRRRMGWLVWSTVCIIGVLMMSGSVVYYYIRKG